MKTRRRVNHLYLRTVLSYCATTLRFDFSLTWSVEALAPIFVLIFSPPVFEYLSMRLGIAVLVGICLRQ